MSARPKIREAMLLMNGMKRKAVQITRLESDKACDG
jgi:hypothetical protein